jgi:hypothetical protein
VAASVFSLIETLALSVSLLFALCAGAQAQRLDGVVIRRAQLQVAGWQRLSEILDGAVGWSRASTDALTYSASPDRLPSVGVSAPGAPEWLVFIDGMRIPTSLFGLHLLELLPITTTQIDSVRVVRGPVIVYGRIAARGAIEVFSTRVPQDASAAIELQHGDETGDSGPFRFTDLWTPNVEKVGPFVNGHTAYASPRWEIRGGIHVASLNLSDTLIAGRFPGERFYETLRGDALAVTPSLRISFTPGNSLSRHDLIASRGMQRGLFYVPASRREQMLDIEQTYAAIGGRGMAGDTRLAYALTGSAIDVGPLASPLPFTVGHTRRSTDVQIDAERDLGRISITATGGAAQSDLTRGGTSDSRASSRAGVGATGPVGSATQISARAVANRSAGRTVVDAHIDGRVALGGAGTTLIETSAAITHPMSDGNSEWMDRAILVPGVGFRTLEMSALAVAVRRTLGAPGRRSGSVSGAARLVRTSDWELLAPPAATGGTVVASIDSALHPATIAIVGASVHVEDSVSFVSLSFEHGAPLSADPAMRDAIRSTVADQLLAEVGVTPVTNIRVGLRVDVGSSAWWRTFTTARAGPTVPSRRRIDVTVEKWAWQRRLRIHLLLRNVLNEDERYHPDGAQWNLRSHLTVSMVLP